LGDYIVPQLVGGLVGGPVLGALLVAFVLAALKGPTADLALQRQWRGVVCWGLLFNGVWLCLLFVVDPATWGRMHGWSDAVFFVLYFAPTAVLSAGLLWVGRTHRAVAVAASCLLVVIGHLLWVLV